MKMTRVMATGVFDIIHTGHISYLEQARSFGDELYVVIACDDTVKKRKHDPVIPQEMRAKIVSSLKPVDKVFIGKNNGDFYSMIDEIRPDIIVLGYDQTFDERKLEDDLRTRGFNIKVKRASQASDDLNATRAIIKKIQERDDF